MNHSSIAHLSAFPALLLALTLLATDARADRNDPGSLLIFPEYDSRGGSYTFLTVTNVHSSESVRVHFNYVDGESCLKTNAIKTLTPKDTVTFYTTTQSPNPGRGYVFAYASSVTSGAPIDFDFLIGSEITLDGSTSSEYSMNALVFEGQTGHGNSTEMSGDGNRDLDGTEYSMTPDKIAIPRFFGQISGPGMPHAELIMIGLTGTKFSTTVAFQIYNDNEESFSSEYTFDCWERVPLSSISGAFDNSFLVSTNHDSGEIAGFPLWESGWFVLNGAIANSTTTSVSNPAMLAAMVEVSRLSAADLPFTIGSQSNGSLLPTSLSGN